ncbi:hypothetical protein [Pseudomonas sp. B22129]|uniref:hypothetical protein n=1 Tax=Pseudomonas sp. B22129 TaxID=3235111 RepID=UPI003784120C
MREDLTGIPGPTLYRLMDLRNALVALKGPLADNPAFYDSLLRRLFMDEEPIKDSACIVKRPPTY